MKVSNLYPRSMAQPMAPDYGQQLLVPPAFEDWARDHPVRFIREFVAQQDLGRLGFAIRTPKRSRALRRIGHVRQVLESPSSVAQLLCPSTMECALPRVEGRPLPLSIR